MIARSGLLLCTTTVSFVFRRWTGGLGKGSSQGRRPLWARASKYVYLQAVCRSPWSFIVDREARGQRRDACAYCCGVEEREHESTGGAAVDDLSRLISTVVTVSC